MEINVLCYIATTEKQATGSETWAIITDYGLTKECYSSVPKTATNNSTILDAVMYLVASLDVSKYAPTVFIVGHKYIVRILEKITSGTPIHMLQDKPLRNKDMWKRLYSMSLGSITWKSVEATFLPGTREVAHLVGVYNAKLD